MISCMIHVFFSVLPIGAAKPGVRSVQPPIASTNVSLLFQNAVKSLKIKVIFET